MKPKTVRRAHPKLASFETLAQMVQSTEGEHPSGIAAGSSILTAKGEMPVENLRVGDRIITRDMGMAHLTDIRSISVDKAYRIRAGVTGVDRPVCDLLVTEGQRILLRDWRAKVLFGTAEALVPVNCMADGHFITREENCDLVFHRLTFETPHILYVDGLEIASARPVTQDA